MKIAVTGKGGVGKTTFAATLARLYADEGKKVLAADVDPDANLGLALGFDEETLDSIVPISKMRKLVEDLREDFDYILLDCPAGIEQGFKNAIAGADRAFVVTTPEVSAIRDADRIIGLLEANEITKTDLIVNRIRMDMVRRGDMMSIEDVTDILGIPVIGAVPDDEEIVISTNQGEPLVGMNSFSGQAYLNICRRILGQEVPLMELERSRGFFTRFKGFLKRA